MKKTSTPATIQSAAAIATHAPHRLYHSSTASSISLLARPMKTVIWTSASPSTSGTEKIA